MRSPSGLFFLTVAIGSDLVVWNLGRRYGSLRLPLLLQGWKTLDIVGWDDKRAIADSNYRQRYEPVFVLTPTHDNDNDNDHATPDSQALNTDTATHSHQRQQAGSSSLPSSQLHQHMQEDL